MPTYKLLDEKIISQRRVPELSMLCENMSLPAMIFRNGSFRFANRALIEKVNLKQLNALKKSSRIQQLTRQVNFVRDSISFDLTEGDDTFHCIVSSLNSTSEDVLILLEDISSIAQTEKNNALLYRLTLLLASTKQPLVDKLQLAVDQILFEIPALDCSILLFDKKTGRLYPVAWGSTNVSSTINWSRRFKLGEGIAGHVALTKTPIVIPNVLADPRFIEQEPITKPHALMSVPIVQSAELFGVICLTRELSTTFTDKDIQLFTTIASRLASLIESDRIKEEILNEQKKLQQIQNTLHDGLILYTLDSKVAMYNQAAKKILGLKKDILGLPWETVLKRDIDKYCSYRLIRQFDPLQFLRLAVEEGKVSHGLALVDARPQKTIQIVVAPVYDHKNNVSGILSHFRDITEVHELQTKMAARVKQLTNLFKISSVSGFNVQQIVKRILHLVLQLLTVRTCRLILLDPESGQSYVVETAGLAKLCENNKAQINHKIKTVIRTKKASHLKIKQATTKEILHIVVVPICGHNNACMGALVVVDHDDHKPFTSEEINLLLIVTSRIASKIDNAWLVRQIEHDREKLSSIIEQSVDGILVTNEQLVVEIWNPALEQLSDISANEAIGQTTDYVQSLVEYLEYIESDNLIEVKFRNKKTDRIGWLGIAYAPIKIDNEVTGYIAILRDIARQKSLEEAKNEFVSTASHELRSPLTAIVGYLSMLKRGDAGRIINQQQAFFVDKAYQNSKRMVMLVEDLLTTTRVEADQIRYHVETLDLIKIIDNILCDARFKIEEKKMTVRLHRERIGNVLGDYDGVHQIISNLLNNALKYTPDSGKIDIGFTRIIENSQPMLQISIADTGVGIDPDYSEKIFDKFGRVDNPLSVHAGGAGLGLYITKSIVLKLGGRIWFARNKFKGSVFNFTLPLIYNDKERNK